MISILYSTLPNVLFSHTLLSNLLGVIVPLNTIPFISFKFYSMPFLFFGKKKKKTKEKEKEDKKTDQKDVKKSITHSPAIPTSSTAEVANKVLFTPNYAAPATNNVTPSIPAAQRDSKEQPKEKEKEIVKDKEKDPISPIEVMPDEKKLNLLFEALLVKY